MTFYVFQSGCPVKTFYENSIIFLFLQDNCLLYFADSIYTERYMLTPKQNPRGYEVISIYSRVGNSLIYSRVGNSL